ncbi:hypothetical protein ACFW1F_36620 [Streptomyces bungoensis]|uniref:hypothetical protein n=1 Tax=Streptomyces bungoensis TaxID=285568 RepID=UPI00343E6C6E
MRKLHKAAVAAAFIGCFGFIATGTAAAEGMGGGGGCKSHDLNIALLDQINIGGGIAGNLLNGEGSPGGQWGHVGSECGGGY